MSLAILKKLFSKGWFKAVFIALPVTLYYGYLCIIGLFVGSMPLLNKYVWKKSWGTDFTLIEGVILMASILGILGILGAWCAFLFQERLATKITSFNKLIASFLICGIASVCLIIFFIFPDIFSHFYLTSFLLIFLIPLLIAIYGVFVTAKVLHSEEKLFRLFKNKS